MNYIVNSRFRYLARDVTEIAEVPGHQSLIAIGSEILLPLHFRGTHSGVVLHEEADASRDAQPQLQRPIIQLHHKPCTTQV